MKLNKKLEVAMSVLTALKGQGQPLTGKELAVAVGSTSDFVSQILNSLGHAGLVSSAKGPGGGYSIAKSNVNALHVAQALGKDFDTTSSYGESATNRLNLAIAEAFRSVRI